MTEEHDEEHHFPSRRKEEKFKKKLASKKDRSRYKKTDLDKRERLQKEEARSKIAKKNLKRGRILSITPDEVHVDSDGESYFCTLSGILKKEVRHSKNILTTGDFVLFEADKRTISFVEERKTILSRQEQHRRQKEQLIAANIDLVLITVSLKDPAIKPPLIDRYIIAARKGRMEPVIVVNKIDLISENSSEKQSLDEMTSLYRNLGFIIISVSAMTGVGLEELKKIMSGKASVFSGQSGVGKSSLINALTGLSLEIGDLAKTRKGSHTTTSAKLIPLIFGGWCIDTPGIKSFGLWDLKREDLETYFHEISSVGKMCYYPNCSHRHEPHCAVQVALQRGTLSKIRYKSYQKLLDDISEQQQYYSN
jgi:ribosome biogenesis GTPase